MPENVWRDNIHELAAVECPLCGDDVNRDDFATHIADCGD